MDLEFIKHQKFQSFIKKCWTLLMNVSLSLKKNSVSKNMLIIVSILVVLILLNFWLIVTAVVCFAIGYSRWLMSLQKVYYLG